MAADVQYDIGGLKARMDEHDKRFDRLEKKVDAGFDGINRKLDGLKASEQRRKGAMGLIKLALGAGGVYSLIDLVKGLWHK